MKSALILLCAISASLAFPFEEPEGCEFCRKGTSLMFAKLSSDEGVKAEIKLLAEKVCPEAPDAKGCAAGVEKWWPAIAKIIYNDVSAKIVCKGLSEGKCEAFNIKKEGKWNCETCMKDVKAVAMAYGCDEGIKGLVKGLEGEAFCKSKWLDLDEEQTKVCQEAIMKFMPPAMKTMQAAIDMKAKDLCMDWFDQCKA